MNLEVILSFYFLQVVIFVADAINRKFNGRIQENRKEREPCVWKN